MAVGTDIGTVYRGRQGEGLATTFDTRMLQQGLMQDQALQARRNLAAQEDRAKKTKDAKEGKTWHFYQNNLAQEVQGLLESGSQLSVQKGIDPWTSTDPDASEWRQRMANVPRTIANIDQYQDQYTKAIQAIAVREKDYDPDYVEQVKAFPQMYDYEALKDGRVQFPVPKFYNPGNLYSNLYVKDAKLYKESLGEGEPARPSDIRNRVMMYAQDPANAADVQAGRQIFEGLSDNDKEYYADVARREGFSEPWEAHAAENYSLMMGNEVMDLMGKASAFAANANMKKFDSKIQDPSGVTTTAGSLRFADPNYPENTARSFFSRYDYILDKPAELAQLGIDMEAVPNRETRRALAEQSFARKIRDNEPKQIKTGLDRPSDGGLSSDEVLSNYDLWRQTVGSKNPVVRDEAAGFVTNVKGFAGQGPVKSARVVERSSPTGYAPRGMAVMPTDSEMTRSLAVQFANQKEADAVRRKFAQELYKGGDISLTEDERIAISQQFAGDPSSIAIKEEETLSKKRDAFASYLRELDRQSQGNEIHIPLHGGRSEQVLKHIHALSASQKGYLYESTLKGERPFEVPSTPIEGFNNPALSQPEDPFNYLKK